MRTMLDGIIVGDVDAAISKNRATLVAGYVNGLWPDYDQMVQKLPQLGHLSISVDAADADALCLDVENGDASPAEAPGWVLKVRARGGIPWVYMNASTWTAVTAEFVKANVPEPYYWVAKYDENPTIPAGAVAKQHTSTLGYDVSSVIDYIAGFDPDPFQGHSVMEGDMPTIESLTDHPGEYAWGFSAGGYSAVQFNCDGYGQQVELRVVIWDENGCNVHEGIVVGGAGNAPAQHRTIVHFATPSGTYGVTVHRMDHTAVPIGVAFL